MHSVTNFLKQAIRTVILRFNGHRIIARAYKTPAGTISFVTVQRDRLAFIEAKRHRAAVFPSRHRRRIIRAAQYWLAAHPDFPKSEIGFDALFGAAWPKYVQDIINLPASEAVMPPPQGR